VADRGQGVSLSLHHLASFGGLAVLVALMASAVGLTMGCSVGQTQTGLMFSLVLAPMFFVACTYCPSRSSLTPFLWLKVAVHINPVLYVSAGVRAALVPPFPHRRIPFVMGRPTLFDAACLVVAGLRQFWKKAVG
jgi:ABC-2 type transport system permease protein